MAVSPDNCVGVGLAVEESPDRYRREIKLGAGGAGEVWRAHDTRLDRQVALKLLHPEAEQDPDMAARFQREARLAAGLDHGNVVAVHNFGRVEGRLFIDSRYIEGRNLASVIAREELTVGRVLHIVEQIAAALDHAHRHSPPIVHRDVKPANVLVAAKPDHANRDRVFLTDFGIARALDGHPSITQQGVVIGTPAYMSPELQCAGSVDHRTDVYALAVVVFEMLTGKRPFERAHDHLTAPIPPVTAIARDLPSTIDDVLAAGLAKDPEERCPSAPALVAAARTALADVLVAPVGNRSRNAAAGAAPTRVGGRLWREPTQPLVEWGGDAPVATRRSTASAAHNENRMSESIVVPPAEARASWFASGPHAAGLVAVVLLIPGYLLGIVQLDATVFVVAVLLYCTSPARWSVYWPIASRGVGRDGALGQRCGPGWRRGHARRRAGRVVRLPCLRQPVVAVLELGPYR